MRITGCVNAYQDAAFLEQSLQVLSRLVDRIIVVDGAYRDFPLYGPGPASVDGTLEVARRHRATIIEAGAQPWPDEIAKRNAYLAPEHYAQGDYVMVVDADEICEGEVDRDFLAEQEDWLVELYLVGAAGGRDGCPYSIHRLYRWRPGIQYAGTHHAVHVGTRMIHPDRDLQRPRDVFPGLRLRHLSAQRDRERQARKAGYYQRLAKAEAAFRGAHDL